MERFFICDRCIEDTNVGKYNEAEAECTRCRIKRPGAYVTMQDIVNADKLGKEPETGLFWKGTVRALNVAYSNAVCPTCGSNVIDRLKKECMEGRSSALRYKCRNCLRPLRIGHDCPPGVGDLVENVEDLAKWLDMHKIILKVGESFIDKEEGAKLALYEDIPGHRKHYLFFVNEKTNRVVGRTLRITNIHHSSQIGASQVVIDKMLHRSFSSGVICQWPTRG